MVSNTIAIVAILLFIALIAVTGVRTAIGKLKAKPGYADINELAAIRGVIAAALRPQGVTKLLFSAPRKFEPPYGALLMLQTRLGYPAMFSGYLTADDVALVAPFVERWLAGDLPHLLSSEYDDEMRIPLLRYKARMQANGLWPKAA
jgi:hypothetical protein